MSKSNLQVEFYQTDSTQKEIAQKVGRSETYVSKVFANPDKYDSEKAQEIKKLAQEAIDKHKKSKAS